jgi:B9 domain-containing protein 1
MSDDGGRVGLDLPSQRARGEARGGSPRRPAAAAAADSRSPARAPRGETPSRVGSVQRETLEESRARRGSMREERLLRMEERRKRAGTPNDSPRGVSPRGAGGARAADDDDDDDNNDDKDTGPGARDADASDSKRAETPNPGQVGSKASGRWGRVRNTVMTGGAAEAAAGPVLAAAAQQRAPEKLPDVSHFVVAFNGQIESVLFSSGDDFYVKFAVIYGEDWTLLSGVKQGISQMGMRGAVSANQAVAWNFPLDLSFRSTNAFGWPQLALAVYGTDWAGNDVIRGYGSCLLPLSGGTSTKYVRLFAPKSASWMREFVTWLTGERTELQDPTFAARGTDRKVVNVRSDGLVKIRINVTTKNLAAFGFSEAVAHGSAPETS